MLSPVESFFVRLLRGTVIFTASVSFAATIAALLYAAYAHYAPEPKVQLTAHIDEFRAATDPVKLIKKLFPANSDIVKRAAEMPNRVTYQRTNASVPAIYGEFNKFLDAFLGGSFESQDLFVNWLVGQNSIGLSWSQMIDDRDATNESNVNFLWRSMLLDYAKRLQIQAPLLAEFNKKDQYKDSFDRLTAPTGRAQAPYFLAWYFEALQKELQQVATKLTEEKDEREVLRAQTPIALYAAMAAFGYFILIMFLFLVVSIEASLRLTAESASATPPGNLNPAGNTEPDPAPASA